jgi:ribosomal protein S18 acetylase RimI-like enzyme
MQTQFTIEDVRPEDLDAAAAVYLAGLQMQTPPGGIGGTVEYIKTKMNGYRILVYKEGDRILGLVSYSINADHQAEIDFICALEPGRGIGTSLLREMAKLIAAQDVSEVLSSMSSLDERAMNFYKRSGFTIYAEKRERDNFLIYLIKADATKLATL